MFSICSTLWALPDSTRGVSRWAPALKPLTDHGSSSVATLKRRSICRSGPFARALGWPFSDGTLIRGGYDFAGQKCRFALAIEGGAEVSITRTDGHEALQLDSPIDWISVAAGDDLICANELSAPESAQLALEMDEVHAA